MLVGQTRDPVDVGVDLDDVRGPANYRRLMMLESAAVRKNLASCFSVKIDSQCYFAENKAFGR